MSDIDLDELDQLYAEAMKIRERARSLKIFGLVMRKHYPALSARLRELEKSRDEWKTAWYALDHDSRAELEAVREENERYRRKIGDRVEYAVGATTRDPDALPPPPEPER